MKVNAAGEGLTPRLPARSTCFKCKYPSIQANSGPFCCPPQSSGTGPSLHSYLHCSCRLIPQGSWAAGPLSPQPSSKPGQERSCKVFCPPESNSETNHPQFAHLPPPPSPPVLFTLPPRSANACCCLQPGIPRIPAGGRVHSPFPPSFNPTHHATVHDIIWHKHHLSFTIKRSKTDQLGRGTSISIQKSSRPSAFCPYRTINRYVRRLPHIDPCTTPLFCFRDGTPLSRSACHKFLSHLLSQAGYRASEYNTHSFRIGAATSAAMAGVPGRVIKRLG